MKKFYIAYDTDVGIKKKTNQDSLLLKGCSEEHGETLLIAICDGMGGMEKGELASATVVRAFSDWFEQVYIKNEMHVGDEGIRQQWQSLGRNKWQTDQVWKRKPDSAWNNNKCGFIKQ